MLINIRETLFVMHCPCTDNENTDVNITLNKTETNQSRTSFKKNPTTKWHIDPWSKITEFLTFRAVFIDFIYQNLDLDITYFFKPSSDMSSDHKDLSGQGKKKKKSYE